MTMYQPSQRRIKRPGRATSPVTPQKIIGLCSDLQASWIQRNYQFMEWYELITMVDKLHEPKMESVVTNEPRTFYNMALHLLVPELLAPRIPLENVAPEDIEDATVWEDFLKDQFVRFERISHGRGRGGWFRELVSFLLITGWYAVFSMVTENQVIGEVWNPADVFPEFGDDGVFRVAHNYSVPGKVANRKAAVHQWNLSREYSDTEWVTIYDYWTSETGDIMNSIVVKDEFAKPLQIEPALDRIPVYVSPVAGLPDRGSISMGIGADTTYGIGGYWKRHVGEGLMAVNINVFNYLNKLYTFLMQEIRDTAQTRWLEKSAGDAKVKPEDIFKRGALFHLGLNEDFGPVQMPPIPPEIRTALFDFSGMRQKGSLPDQIYGNVMQNISGYLMSQIAGAAAHILRPYQHALKFLVEELCNDWMEDIRQYKFEPYNQKLSSKKFPKVVADIRVDVPGETVQRATVARMLNPNFQLSTETVTDMFFPEIKNPLAEQAKVAKDRAVQHPVMQALNLIEALKQRAALLAAAGDAKGAALYTKAADMVLGQGQQQSQASTGTVPPEIASMYPQELPQGGSR